MPENGPVLIKIIKPGLELRVNHDEYTTSPRRKHPLTTIVAWNQHFDISDLHHLKTPEEFWLHFWTEAIPNLLDRTQYFDGEDYDDLPDSVRRRIEKRKTFPGAIRELRLHQHGDVTLSTRPLGGSTWQPGQAGWVYITRDTMKKNKLSRRQAERIIRQDIRQYETYINGRIYTVGIYRDGDTDDVVTGNLYLDDDTDASLTREQVLDRDLEDILEGLDVTGDEVKLAQTAPWTEPRHLIKRVTYSLPGH